MMKKIIMILILCLGAAKLKAQTFTKYADTANYLIHEIENKKALFIDKPMSVLLDSLKINPVRSFTAVLPKSAFGKKLYLDFNYERVFEKSHYIILEFDSIPSYNQLFPIFYPSTGRGTLQSIIAVYQSLIVKDVLVKDYNDDEPIDPDVHY